ncbi:cobyric acid synthase [Priestia koreensis]|uniref:cobyric acid synthase n=1 Tax=Priestia koreensis TaxID=284581 RepID=UPI0028F7413F|nr:cobyric acid synthase [Priestia koreensis]
MTKSLPVMFQGTHSDSGKSTLVTAFCRIFVQDGYKTAPFKSQNMALNSYITYDGKEIGRAQGVQAEAANVQATTDMNPILIKPNRDNESHVIVHGKFYANMQASKYRSDFFYEGLALIEKSLNVLSGSYERIVIEGAGSPAEVNLNDRELVNMRVAKLANAPVILVGDIEKGGVFASLVGTLQLLSEEERSRVIGVIINKFRGDVELLKPGLTWFEEYTNKPVLGVIPYLDHLNIEAEDSVVLQQYKSDYDGEKEIDIAVIQYPRISNFTDIDPFFAEPDCDVRFVRQLKQLKNPDVIILPGSKNTIEDLFFLKKSGLYEQISSLYKSGEVTVVGICGGYQMLGENIQDPYQIESEYGQIQGLQLIPMQTVMNKEKVTTWSEGETTGDKLSVKGYEIHMGESTFSTEERPFITLKDGRNEGFISGNNGLLGTYFHGIFHNDALREHFLNEVRKRKHLPPITGRVNFNEMREQAFDRLADHVRSHVDVQWITEQMEQFQKGETSYEHTHRNTGIE